jgi:GTP pyrophosphokinase
VGDEDEMVAGLLHDTWEDHPDLINLEVIGEMFGERVAFLVDGVTKLKTKEGDKNEFETLRKVTRESLIDVGVAKIKLADRKHNMMTMEGMKPETQKNKAKETLAVYAPLEVVWDVASEKGVGRFVFCLF